MYYVTATKAPGCTATDSVSVTDNGVDVTLITPSGSNRIDQCEAENVRQIDSRTDSDSEKKDRGILEMERLQPKKTLPINMQQRGIIP